jgi:hypothetical protein
MSYRIVRAVTLAAIVPVAACVTEISTEERLERETVHIQAIKSKTGGELSKLRCDDVNGELAKARDDAKSEESRLRTYVELYETVRSRTTTFDEALAHNPDLAYQEGSQEITTARDGCVQSQADVRLDLEGLVREVLEVPTVDEIHGGSTIKVARLSFEVLRNAIGALDLDDREALLKKVSAAEKSIEAKEGKRKK